MNAHEAAKFLMRCPANATIRAYEGEICGVIVEVPLGNLGYREIAYLHNDGEVKILDSELIK